MVAIGRQPFTQNIGLDNVGISNENGFINVDLETMQTSTANIYALGDIVKDTPQLAHVAFAEAIAAVTHIATGEKSPVNYSAIPYVVYTNPELAEVGTNSDKAKVNELNVSQSQHSFVLWEGL